MHLRDDVKQIMCDRPAERVWFMVMDPGDPGGAHDFDALARAAGLEPLGRAWIEVDAERARRLLTLLLHQDLAYNSELMPIHRAEWLAAQFLGAFGRYNSRFATNLRGVQGEYPFEWNPATEFAMDGGIAVIGEAGSGIYWVADED